MQTVVRTRPHALDVLTVRRLVGSVVSAETFDAAWTDRRHDAAERLRE